MATNFFAADKAYLSVSSGLEADHEAFAYCQSHKYCYIVIVWPRGYSHLEYITEKLNEYAAVKYVKQMPLNADALFQLYRKLHTKMSYKSAKKYFKPYVSGVMKDYRPYNCAALVLYTDQPLEKIVAWKKEIRDHIGQSYYSIHINDYYYPGTIEAAQAVFKDLAHSTKGDRSC